LLPALDVGIQDVPLNRKVVDVMRNSKSQARGVPGRRRGGRTVAGRRTAGATDMRALADDLGALEYMEMRWPLIAAKTRD
jgi:hypothetical protein